MSEEFTKTAMEQETEQMLRIRYLNQDNAKFIDKQNGFLGLEIEDEHYDRVQVVKMFPLSMENELFSIRTVEERSLEIGIVEKLSDFPEEVQKLLVAQLKLGYFTPKITRINSIKDEYGYAYFDVETDKGHCLFTIQMGSNAVVHLSDTRILIMDIDENRFEIPDIDELTNKERKKLDLFL